MSVYKNYKYFLKDYFNLLTCLHFMLFSFLLIVPDFWLVFSLSIQTFQHLLWSNSARKNSFTFCLAKGVFILPSFWKYIFYWIWNLELTWQCFFSSCIKKKFIPLLPALHFLFLMKSDPKFLSLFHCSLYALFLFSLTLSISNFQQFHYYVSSFVSYLTCLDFFELFRYVFCCVIFFSKFSAIISSSISSIPFFLFLLGSNYIYFRPFGLFDFFTLFSLYYSLDNLF